MPKRVKLCLPRPLQHLDLDKVEWKPANLNGTTLRYILITCYDDEQDQLLMAEWNSSNVPVSFASKFSGYTYYEKYNL